jgi:hypothetical protein
MFAPGFAEGWEAECDPSTSSPAIGASNCPGLASLTASISCHVRRQQIVIGRTSLETLALGLANQDP